ncbi:YqjF family protein [Pseudonocardia xinjiangensis]|uniref:YqjF family protein n=1 Tax=Pseudonocardia xinjiangensis TaxID=75289 RepID=UPI003D92F141
MPPEPVAPEPVSVVAPALPHPHLLRQRWRDVAFLHWAVRPAAVARFFPPGVEPDVLDGWTYVGLVPFRMTGTGFAHGPTLPWVGTFLETNVRLYSVDATGRRGVVFLSLDAERAVAVAAARAAFGLPYRWARMRFVADGDVRGYATRVRWPGVSARSRIVVRAGTQAPDGPLEQFLTARWGLHTAHLGRTWYLPNEHATWPLRTAEVLELDDGLIAAAGLGDLTHRPPDHVAFSDGAYVRFGNPTPATTPRGSGKPLSGPLRAGKWLS